MTAALASLLAEVRALSRSACIGCERHIPHFCQREFLRLALERYDGAGKTPASRPSKFATCARGRGGCREPDLCDNAGGCIETLRASGMEATTDG